MKLIITPSEAITIAFPGTAENLKQYVNEADILSVQDKFIRPVVGAALYQEILSGCHPELVQRYICPAIAYYIKYSVLATIGTVAGNFGVVRPRGEGYLPASQPEISVIRAAARKQAEMYITMMSRHIEADPVNYPAYEPADNIHNRITIGSGILM